MSSCEDILNGCKPGWTDRAKNTPSLLKIGRRLQSRGLSSKWNACSDITRKFFYLQLAWANFERRAVEMLGAMLRQQIVAASGYVGHILENLLA